MDPRGQLRQEGRRQGHRRPAVLHDESDSRSASTKQVVLSVKPGNPAFAHVRDLRGVLDREGAAIGVLITLQEPTGPMKAEAASAGVYDSPWGTQHARLQILSIPELLDGRSIGMPPSRDLRTFKKAPRQRGAGKGETSLFGRDGGDA